MTIGNKDNLQMDMFEAETPKVELNLEDPGKHEGTRGTDILKTGHPRFEKVYWQMKEYERQLKEKEVKQSETDKLIAAMKKHNEELSVTITKAITPEVPAVSEVLKLRDQRTEIHKQLVDLKTKLSIAIKDEDTITAVKLQGEVGDLKLDLVSLDNKIVLEEIKPKTSEPSEADKKAFSDWLDRNDWYKTDKKAKTYADMLAVEYKDEVKSYDELLTKVEQDTRDLFSKELEDSSESIVVKKPMRASNVESGSSVEGKEANRNKGKTTLTDDEKAVGALFGVSDEHLLNQKRYKESGGRI